MSSGPTKKHKRSGSVVVHTASAAPARHKSRGPALHGKFQAKLKQPKERKNIDQANTLTTFDVPASASVTLLNTYATGTTGNSTLGRRVINKSVHVRMTVSLDGSGSAANQLYYGQTCRVLVVYDRQPNGATPAASVILQDTAALASAVMNLQYSDRFSVIMDEKFALGPFTVGATAGVPQNFAGESVYMVDRYVKVGLPTVAAGNSFTGAIAGIAEGAIWLIAFSDVGSASAGSAKIKSMLTRVRFQDD